jgi:hypothetical protein
MLTVRASVHGPGCQKVRNPSSGVLFERPPASTVGGLLQGLGFEEIEFE